MEEGLAVGESSRYTQVRQGADDHFPFSRTWHSRHSSKPIGTCKPEVSSVDTLCTYSRDRLAVEAFRIDFRVDDRTPVRQSQTSDRTRTFRPLMRGIRARIYGIKFR